MKNLLVLFTSALLLGCATTGFQPKAINEVPMYGAGVFTPDQQKANEEFVQSVLDSGRTRGEGSADAVKTGYRYLNRGDLSTAIKRFNQGWLLNQDNPDVYGGFGVWYGRQERYEDAAVMLLLGLEKEPSHRHLLHDLGYTYNMLGIRHLYVFGDLKTQDPQETALARTFFEKALVSLGKDIELHPDYSAAYLTRAASYQHLGRLDDAIADAQVAQRLGEAQATGYLDHLRQRRGR